MPSPDAVPVGRDAERAALTAELDAAAAGAFSAGPGRGGARHREDPPRRGPGGARPSARLHRRRRPVLAGRRGSTAVAVAFCARDPRELYRPGRARRRRADAGPVRVRPLERHRAPGGRRGHDHPAAGGARRPPLVRRRDAAHVGPRAGHDPAGARLCVVGTRRAHPEPTGALALVAESFARRHAARSTSPVSTAEGTAALLGGVTADVPAAAGRRLARPLRREPVLPRGAGPARSGRPDHVPPTVRDVVTRRLSELPERARQSLVTAAVTGRRFRPEVVAAANGTDLDDVADDLDAARAADLVVEEEPGELAFAHALTRRPVYLAEPDTGARGGTPGSRTPSRPTPSSGAHAGPGAHRRAGPALAGRGTSHADRAWRAARGPPPRPGSVRGARRGHAAARGRGGRAPPRRRRGRPRALRPAARARRPTRRTPVTGRRSRTPLSRRSPSAGRSARRR